MGILPEDIKPAMQGWIPAVIATCSLHGIPNVSEITQVYYLDEDYIALSFQFFNKTKKNITENPFACIQLRHPHSFERYILEVVFDHSETEGPLFNKMDMQIEALATISGMSGIFKLKGADVYKVLSVKRESTEIQGSVNYRIPPLLVIGFKILKTIIFIKKKFHNVFKRG